MYTTIGFPLSLADFNAAALVRSQLGSADAKVVVTNSIASPVSPRSGHPNWELRESIAFSPKGT